MKKTSMNVPNILSIIRVLLVPVFVVTLLAMREIKWWGLIVPTLVYGLTALTDMLEHDACEEDFALAREMQPIWRKAAELMLRGDYYPLTPAHATADDFYAMAFYDEAAGEGFLNVVSNNRNEKATFTAVLDMLDADAVYTLTEAETGETATYSGTELQKGFTAALPQRSGKVYFLKKA